MTIEVEDSGNQVIVEKMVQPVLVLGKDEDGNMAILNIGDGTVPVLNVAVEPGQASGEPYDTHDATPIWTPLRWTPVGDGQIITGACVVHGFRVLAGTNPTLDLYDGTSTGGTPILTTAGTLTVGQYYPLMAAAGGSQAGGVLCASGLYGNQGGTSPDFLFFAKFSQPQS